jgi:hypothetical protein
MNYNLLLNNYSEDIPAIAVIKDVNLEKFDSFISTLELVLQEHYCGSNSVTFPNGFPDDVSSRPYPVFCVDFQVEDNNGDDLWDMDCGVSNTRSKLLTND